MSLGLAAFDQIVRLDRVTPDEVDTATARIHAAATNPCEAALFLAAINPTPNEPNAPGSGRRARPRHGISA